MCVCMDRTSILIPASKLLALLSSKALVAVIIFDTEAEQRVGQMWIAAEAASRKSLASKLISEQDRVTKELAKTVQAAMNRGWVQDHLDPIVLAEFIQAYTLGRAVDDVSSVNMDPVKWAGFIKHMVASSMLRL